jgi:cytochrome c oxidase assembly protein subunit 15
MILNNFKNESLIKVWLLSLIILIILMIIIGGLTRLTDSGLSITEWQLFSGILPPLNSSQWDKYFQLYKEIPQYKFLNYDMTISEFKVIFFWEYLHRMLGRLIGLTFLIPFIYFIYKSIITVDYKIKFSLIFLLILFQGVIGWYMVQSGLTDNLSVSHYRLSFHLTIAFVILSCLVWIYLNFNTGNNKKFFSNFFKLNLLKILIILLFIQIIIGAFVSGLDAGKIYQTWPLMNDNFFPNDFKITKFNDLFNFDNHSWVQFLHRINAYLILLLVILFGFKLMITKNFTLLKPYLLVLFGIFIQSILGIFTLISNLNIVIASLHQISSIFLMIFSIKLYYWSLN